jgi:hypothetical protein
MVSVRTRAHPVLAGVLVGLLWIAWQAIRWPILSLLIVLEPIVRVTLCAFALLGTLTALFWRFAVDPPGFPFFTILLLSLACVPLLALYYTLLRVFAGRW